MNWGAFYVAALLFGAVLPGSIFFSVIWLMAAGLFREWWEQPPIFRLISRGDSSGRNAGGGDSQEMLAAAARTAGETAGRELVSVLEARSHVERPVIAKLDA